MNETLPLEIDVAGNAVLSPNHIDEIIPHIEERHFKAEIPREMFSIAKRYRLRDEKLTLPILYSHFNAGQVDTIEKWILDIGIPSVTAAKRLAKANNSVKPVGTELTTPDWPILSEKALPGVLGEFISLATESSEADPAAIAATFLVRFGVDVGSGPHMWIGDAEHHCRLAAVVVGDSSKARKGTSAKPVSRIFRMSPTDSYCPAKAENASFSTGEGIIYLIRDKQEKFDEKEQQMIVVDPGVDDKRLFIMDEEFAGVLANTKREGNTLSMIIRNMWDSGNLAPIIKNKRTVATGGHVGWVSHITLYELNARLDESEAFNGFANRILWICSSRKKLVAWPVPMAEIELNVLQLEIAKLVIAATPRQVIKPSADARELWTEKYYPFLSRSRSGLMGAVTNRAEAQTLRLAMIYSLLDGKTTIEMNHLESAFAFWDYCEHSANYIFHGKGTDKVTRKILEALKDGPITGTDLHAAFGRNQPIARLETSLTELIASNKVKKKQVKTDGPGAPLIIYSLTN